MRTPVRHCHYGKGTLMVRHGTTSEGTQRSRYRACLLGRGRPWLLEYTYAGQAPKVKQQLVDMAMPASGIRNPARVLPVSPPTVSNEDNKRRVLPRCGAP